MFTVDQISAIQHEAQIAAYKAAEEFCNTNMGGRDRGACGFAWVDITEYQGVQIKGNTKIGRLLKEAGITQDWKRTFSIWNPSRFPVQSVDILHAGAVAASEVWKRHGFTAYACSRLD